ncbi:MAG: ribose-5-phosphate isomerase RpiA [Candidatus Dormibacteraeota bacterium]|nr:ribose-5-phosphate isomerase RpiA [Candidatus Dormibacteraeota bacterium]
MNLETAKRAAGEAAAELVQDGMRVGLGTGTTARWFVTALGHRIAAGLRVSGVATSYATQRLAQEADVPLHDLTAQGLDLAVDGADQVDPKGNLIKGGGGALVREKIVAASATRFVVVIDSTKLVPALGGRLPIELLGFGVERTLAALERTGGRFFLRETPEGEVERSENGNLLADGVYPQIEDVDALAAQLDATPGVVDHGMFLGMASLVLVGHEDGTVEEINAAGRTVDAGG